MKKSKYDTVRFALIANTPHDIARLLVTRRAAKKISFSNKQSVTTLAFPAVRQEKKKKNLVSSLFSSYFSPAARWRGDLLRKKTLGSKIRGPLLTKIKKAMADGKIQQGVL